MDLCTLGVINGKKEGRKYESRKNSRQYGSYAFVYRKAKNTNKYILFIHLIAGNCTDILQKLALIIILKIIETIFED